MCLPALGDHTKIEIAEFEKPARAYMLAIPTSATKSQKYKNVKCTTKSMMISKLDMFRRGLIHLDISRRRFCISFFSFFLRGDGQSLSYS